MKYLNNTVRFIKRKWEEKPLIGAFVIFFLVFLLCSLMCFINPGALFTDDHFFHFKYAYLLRTQGFNINNHFDWIYLSGYVTNSPFYNTSLFQIALIPFTFIKNLRIGLQVSDIFWAGSALGLIYYSFRKLKINYAFLLTLFLISFSFTIARLLAGRALVFAIGLIFLLIYLAIAKKYYKFFFASLVFVFWHQATFFMPVVIAIIVEVSRYMSFGKFKLKAIAGGLISMLLALWQLSSTGFIAMPFLAEIRSKEGLLGEGTELYKKDIFSISSSSEFFLFTLLLSFAVVFYVFLSNRNIPREKRSQSILNVYVAFLFLLMALGGAILVNGRFSDYYGVGVVFLVGSCISYLKQKKIPIDGNLNKFLFGGILFFLLIIGTNTFINIKRDTYFNDITPIKLVSEWISLKSSNKDKVYLYNWSHFPMAFFYNDKNVYSMGMEPLILLDYDKKLYWKWYNVFNYGIYCEKEESCENEAEEYKESIKNVDEEQKESIIKENGRKIVKSIKNDFNAKYIIISNENNPVMSNEDLISDSFSAKSEINGSVLWAYELK